MSPLASALLKSVSKLEMLLHAKPGEKQPTGAKLGRRSSAPDFDAHRPSSGADATLFNLTGSQLSYHLQGNRTDMKYSVSSTSDFGAAKFLTQRSPNFPDSLYATEAGLFQTLKT